MSWPTGPGLSPRPLILLRDHRNTANEIREVMPQTSNRASASSNGIPAKRAFLTPAESILTNRRSANLFRMNTYVKDRAGGTRVTSHETRVTNLESSATLKPLSPLFATLTQTPGGSPPPSPKVQYSALSNRRPDSAGLRLLQISRHHLCVIGDGHLGLGNVRMPQLLPLETEVSFISRCGQRLHLALHRHAAGSG